MRYENRVGARPPWEETDELEFNCISSCVCLPWVCAVSQGRENENNGAPVSHVRLKSSCRVNNVGGRGVGRGSWGQEAGGSLWEHQHPLRIKLPVLALITLRGDSLFSLALFCPLPDQPPLPLPTRISLPQLTYHRPTTALSFHD